MSIIMHQLMTITGNDYFFSRHVCYDSTCDMFICNNSNLDISTDKILFNKEKKQKNQQKMKKKFDKLCINQKLKSINIVNVKKSSNTRVNQPTQKGMRVRYNPVSYQ